MTDQGDTEVQEPANRDGFAAMAILALTVAFIVFVLVALI